MIHEHHTDYSSMAISRSMTLLSRIYDDAIELTDMARDVLQEHQPAYEGYSLSDDVPLAREVSRLTARLSQVLVWFLTQRSLLKGQVSVSEALSEPFRIIGHPHMIDESGEDNPHIPQDFRELLISSRFLYQRALRLDQLFERNSSHLVDKPRARQKVASASRAAKMTKNKSISRAH